MYTREILNPPESIIKDGKPVFGTFCSPPRCLDIRDVLYPFNVLPLPTFITNLRIRANLSFVFNTPEFIGAIELLDGKLFCFSEVVFWDKKTLKKQAYRSFFGFRRFIPKNLEKAVCITYNPTRYIKFSWNKLKKRFSIVFSLKGNNLRHSSSAALTLDLESPNFAQLFSVLPAPSKRRCHASYICTAPLKGTLSNTTTGDTFECTPDSYAVYDIWRSYYKLRTKSDMLTGIGVVNNQHISFHISFTNHDPFDSDRYNENILFVDGETTPLPPVKITHPFGITGKWIIQDTKSMVDLSFHPLSDIRRFASIVILHADYHTIYGTFDGDLRSKDGKLIHLKDFCGIIKNSSLRM